jgi:hypothetical protein
VEGRKKGERNRTKQQSCQALADCPARRGGRSALATWTVRPGAADSPSRSRGQSVKANRTTRDEPGKTDCPRGPGGPSTRDPDRPLLKLGPSANRLQQQPKTKSDRKRRRARTRRTREEHCTRGQSARHTRTARASRTVAKTARPRRSTPPTHHRFCQTVEAVETRVWGQKSIKQGCYTPKISPPNFLNHQELRIL